jgi:hypothetical protein
LYRNCSPNAATPSSCFAGAADLAGFGAAPDDELAAGAALAGAPSFSALTSAAQPTVIATSASAATVRVIMTTFPRSVGGAGRYALATVTSGGSRIFPVKSRASRRVAAPGAATRPA